MAKKFIIRWDSTVQSYVMSSPYSQVFVEAFKNVIPIGSRHWDAQNKLWYVTEPYGEALKTLIISSFGAAQLEFYSKAQVEADEQKAYAQAVVPSDGIGGTCYDFLSCLLYDEARTLYRKAVMRLHPDRGGDQTVAAKLNDSWRKIEKEIFHK